MLLEKGSVDRIEAGIHHLKLGGFSVLATASREDLVKDIDVYCIFYFVFSVYLGLVSS